MLKLVTFLAISGAVASAQYSFGEKNKEYVGSGKYVTILEEQKIYNKSEYYGAAVVGTNSDTTTFLVMPTALDENGKKHPEGYTLTITQGPTTFEYSQTSDRTFTDLKFTFRESCSFSGTTTAVCTSHMLGMPQPCVGKMGPNDGFLGGTWIRTETFSPPSLGFQTYEIVTKTTSIKDTDPAVTEKITDGPYPTGWVTEGEWSTGCDLRSRTVVEEDGGGVTGVGSESVRETGVGSGSVSVTLVGEGVSASSTGAGSATTTSATATGAGGRRSVRLVVVVLVAVVPVVML